MDKEHDNGKEEISEKQSELDLFRLVERKKKGIAVLVTLEAEEAEKLLGRSAGEFARDKAEELLRGPARLIDESKVETMDGKSGLPVKEFCFIQQKLELL